MLKVKRYRFVRETVVESFSQMICKRNQKFKCYFYFLFLLSEHLCTLLVLSQTDSYFLYDVEILATWHMYNETKYIIWKICGNCIWTTSQKYLAKMSRFHCLSKFNLFCRLLLFSRSYLHFLLKLNSYSLFHPKDGCLTKKRRLH